jgi:hypothetical protein
MILPPLDSCAQDQWLPFPPNAVFETGDTWVANGQRLRLYGVQSCLRGTFFTNVQGSRVDCGESSVALLAAMVRDLKPLCNVSARSGDLAYVVCIANVTVQGRVTRLDLATALITAGYSFAAFNPGVRYMSRILWRKWLHSKPNAASMPSRMCPIPTRSC